MSNKSKCYFGFGVICSGKANIQNEVAIEVLRELNVKWKDCTMKPPNIYIWSDIEVLFSDDDKRDMNLWMDKLKYKWQRSGKIMDLEWWYRRGESIR